MELAELRKLVEAYEPNEKVSRQISQVELLGTIGPSAVGKSTITLGAIQKWPAIQLVLSDVSRSPRRGEKDRVDYYFRSKEAMVTDLKRRNFVQIRPPSPAGDLYATRPSSYPQEGLGTLAIMSRSVEKFRQLPFKEKHLAFIVPNSYERWQAWFDKQTRESGWTKTDEKDRLEEALQSYKFALDGRNPFLAFVLNDDLDKASDRLIQVAKGQLPDDHAKARKIAQENYQKLKERLG